MPWECTQRSGTALNWQTRSVCEGESKRVGLVVIEQPLVNLVAVRRCQGGEAEGLRVVTGLVTVIGVMTGWPR